jgi:hypothetical protein
MRISKKLKGVAWMRYFCCSVSAVFLLAGALSAQEGDAQTGTPKAKYTVLRPKLSAAPAAQTAVPLTTWTGKFTYQGVTYSYNMVGTDPTKTNGTTTIPVFIIPVKIVITKGTQKTTFDPAHVLPNGNTVTANTTASPIFDSTTTYIQGGVNVGTTQYIDAFQRANFWAAVKSKPNYHLLLGTPTVLSTVTLSPPSTKGITGTPFGHKVAEVDINWIDAQFQTTITQNTQITPGSLPIFLLYDTYLTEGGCCIGGYHSAYGNLAAPQAYAEFTYVDYVGDFSQDVSALSHEVGEWADDPLVVNTNGNPVQCGILETGDPEEGFTNFGAFPYAVNGFSYNLQDLVFLPYFGAMKTISVNSSLSFQQNPFGLTVCSNGG